MHSRRYETLILLSPNLSGDEVETFKGKVESILAQGKGQIVRFEDWGRRRLAYPVSKQIHGYYLLYDYQAIPSLSAELERNLKIDEQVFKYLTLILDKNFSDERFSAEKDRLANEAKRKETEQVQSQESKEDTSLGSDLLAFEGDENSEDDDYSELDQEPTEA
jgi:small subunit ribosomal protein S6